MQHPPEVLVLQLGNVGLLLHQPRPHRTRQRRLIVQRAARSRCNALAAAVGLAAAAAAARAGAVRVVVGVAVALRRLPLLQLPPVVLQLAVARGQLLARQEQGRAVLVCAVPVQAGLRVVGRAGCGLVELDEGQQCV